MSRGRQEPAIITAIWEAKDVHLSTEAVFLRDGVIDDDEQAVLDQVDQLYARLEGINLSRLVSRAIEDNPLDVHDPEQIAAVVKLANKHAIRRINEYRRDIPQDAA